MLTLSNGAGDLEFLTWVPSTEDSRPDEDIVEATAEIARHLQANGSVLIQERVYGHLDWADRLLAARDATLRDLGRTGGPPPTFVEGMPCRGSALAGVHAIAAKPSPSRGAEEVLWNGSVAGWWIGGKKAEYLCLSDLARFVPDRERRQAGTETEATFDVAMRILADLGWAFGDVCRTWFYLNDILAWYDEFNAVRNRQFSMFGLFADGDCSPLPASTGISGRNPRGGWCTLDLLAIRAVGEAPPIARRLANPLQNEAPEYGSAFSRGLSLSVGGGRYVLVSGTAAIDDAGRSLHAGDFERQTRRTLDTVGALLRAGGSSWEDVAQATAFIKHEADVPAFMRLLRERGLGRLPIVCTIADVCREELLVELDATAIVAAPVDSSSVREPVEPTVVYDQE